MIYAKNGKDLIPAAPGLKASCPGCGKTVIPKCGMKKIWHWAHEIEDFGCRMSNFSRENDWHATWKSIFPQEWREQTVNKSRADVLLPNGTALEFQYSHIDPETIEKRESDHKKIIWIFRGSIFAYDISIFRKNFYLGFRWLSRQRLFNSIKGRLFLDFLNDADKRYLFEVKDNKSEGWGYRVSQETFIKNIADAPLPKFPLDKKQGSGPNADALGPTGWVM